MENMMIMKADMMKDMTMAMTKADMIDETEEVIPHTETGITTTILITPHIHMADITVHTLMGLVGSIALTEIEVLI
jgi:hypothetical protein